MRQAVYLFYEMNQAGNSNVLFGETPIAAIVTIIEIMLDLKEHVISDSVVVHSPNVLGSVPTQ